ncbi:MAG: XRE family transcriptional regulator, partial [Actinomycetota bacterium]
PLPVRQIADWEITGGQYFEVEENGHTVRHEPALEQVGGKDELRQVVALFARAVNPFNKKRTVTICGGMYGRGTYGAVRALTDERFRDRNAQYLESRFGDSDSYCILTRVQIVNGTAITPDWTIDDNRLFEWPVKPDA